MKINKSWNGPITTSRPKKYVDTKTYIDEKPEFVKKRREIEEKRESAQIDKNHGLEGLDV